jgi:predicted DNA-binding transcriptional regulator AlpA
MQRKHVDVVKTATDLITSVEVETMTGLGAVAILEKRKTGDFPQPVNLASPLSRKRVVRWIRSEVTQWVQEKIAARDREAALEREQTRKDRELLAKSESPNF